MGKRLLLLGAGGHGKVVYEVAHSLCDRDGTPLYTVIDFWMMPSLTLWVKWLNWNLLEGIMTPYFVGLEIMHLGGS